MEDKFELDRFLLVQVLDYDDVKHQSESDGYRTDDRIFFTD